MHAESDNFVAERLRAQDSGLFAFRRKPTEILVLVVEGRVNHDPQGLCKDDPCSLKLENQNPATPDP